MTLPCDLSANAAEDAMVPYFPQIIEELKKYLNPTETEAELKVQLQALGELACSILLLDTLTVTE